ncbi:MAG: hypothetical protein AAF152_04085 [Cyanobacteria bacterium P01_A01_bin.114]
MATQMISVKCPQCQQIYIGWQTASVGTNTDYTPTTICSRCGAKARLHDLVLRNEVYQTPGK